MPNKAFRYSLIFLLAMTEIMPVMLLGQTFPILLRRGGASMDEVGLLYLVMSPWALKFLWAPFIDRFGNQTNGRYRRWLLFVHPILILSVFTLSFLDLPMLLRSQPALSLLLLAGITIICATADTAADGLAISLLSPEERGTGNGFQMAGTMMGNLVGGGLLLVSLDAFGWRVSFTLLALLLVVPYAGILYYREPPHTTRPPLTFKETLAPFRIPKMRQWLVWVACIEASYAAAYTPMQGLLSDKGFSLEEVGLILGILGSLAGTLGGAFGAWAINHHGRRWGFFRFAALTALGVLSMTLAVTPDSPRILVYVTIELTIFGLMALGTILYTMMMDRTRAHVASSDYTLQYCTLQLSSFVTMALGGFLTESFGAVVVFCVVPVLMLVVFGGAFRSLQEKDFSAEPIEDFKTPETPKI